MKTFFTLAFAGVISATAMDSNDYQFIKYIAEHSKQYESVDEYLMRKANYLNIDKEIIRINESNTTSTVGHNFFSDWT